MNQPVAMDVEFSAYFDPNYDPEILYREIEPLLLLYDRLYIYAPLAFHSRKAQMEDERLLRLFESGYVVPVARKEHWDRAERNRRAEECRRNDDDEGFQRFQWSEKFDERVASLPTRNFEWKEASLPSKREVTYDRGTQWAASLHGQPLFRDLMKKLEKGITLPELPNVLRSLPPKELAEKLLYHLGGDLEILTQLGTPECIVSSERQTKVQELYVQLKPKYPNLNRPVVRKETEWEELTKEERRIAKEFALRVAKGHDLSSILSEFKEGPYNKQFRAFVRQTTRSIAHSGVAGDLVEELQERFNVEAERLRTNATVATNIYIPMIGVADYVFFESVLPMLEKKMSRRSVFTVLGMIAAAASFEAWQVADAVGSKVSAQVEQLLEPGLGWISVVVGR